MNTMMNRRGVLTMGGAGLLAAGGFGPAQAQALKGPLNAFIQCHTVGKAEDIALFRQQFSLDTNVSCWTSNTDTLTRFATGAGRTFDVFSISVQMLEPLIRRRLVAPLDWSKIPNTAKMLPQFRQPVNSFVNGRHYSVPWCFGYDTIIHNKDRVPEVDSYGVLFDDRHAGRVALRDDPQLSLIMMGLYFQKPNPFRMNARDLREITDFLIAKKRNIRKLWSGFAEPIALMKSGEVDMVATGWIPMYRALKADGMNVGHATQVKEKVPVWTQDFMMTPEAVNRGMQDTVHAFMNWSISPEITARMGRTAGYVSPSGAGLGILTEAEQKDIGYDAVEAVWKGGVPIAEFPENLQEWNDAWSRFKAA